MSDTPETDAFIASQNYYPTTHQLRNFARIFEMQRDEAREELRTAVQERHDFHWQLLDAVRERDEARDIGEKLSKQGLEMMDENRTLKRERDEAREAIRALAEHGESEIQRITKERDEAREQVDCFREKHDLTPMCWNV